MHVCCSEVQLEFHQLCEHAELEILADGLHLILTDPYNKPQLKVRYPGSAEYKQVREVCDALHTAISHQHGKLPITSPAQLALWSSTRYCRMLQRTNLLLAYTQQLLLCFY